MEKGQAMIFWRNSLSPAGVRAKALSISTLLMGLFVFMLASFPAGLSAQAAERAEVEEAEEGSTVSAETSEGSSPASESVVVEGSRQRYDCPDRQMQSCPAVDLSEGYYETSLNMSEILLGEPGVRMEKEGGVEGPWYPRSRGSAPASVPVYLDGILINDPLGRPVDMSSLPVGVVDYVLVYKGGCPAEYPRSGPAVVDMRLMPARHKERYNGRGTFDTNKSVSGSMSITGDVRGGAAVLATEHQAGPGRYEYTDDKGTYDTDDDDTRRERTNNEFRDHHLAAKYQRDTGDMRVSAGAYHHHRFRRLPGQAHQHPEHAYQNQEMSIVYAGAEQPGFISPDLDAEVKAHYLSESTVLNDESGELGAPSYREDRRSRIGAELFFHYYGVPQNILTFYGGAFQDNYQPSSRLDPDVDDMNASRLSAHVNLADEVYLLDRRLMLKPRLRYLYEGNRYDGTPLSVQQGEDVETTRHSAWTGDLSASYMVYEGLWFLAYAGQHFRTPGFLEEFGDRSELVGNSKLDPQRTVIMQAGALYSPGSFSIVDDLWARVMVFQNRVYDRIGWEDTGAGNLRAENVGDSRITGLEISARLNLEDILLVNMAYSFQEPVNLSDNDRYHEKQLAGVPRNIFYLGTVVRQDYGQIFYDFYYQDTRWLDPANNIASGPRLVHDLGAVYYRGKWSVGIKASNLGNAQEQEVLGYPLPGTRYILFTEVKT
ncbi:MAG: TonB-dependent receptor [bacterium]